MNIITPTPQTGGNKRNVHDACLIWEYFDPIFRESVGDHGDSFSTSKGRGW